MNNLQKQLRDLRNERLYDGEPLLSNGCQYTVYDESVGDGSKEIIIKTFYHCSDVVSRWEMVSILGLETSWGDVLRMLKDKKIDLNHSNSKKNTWLVVQGELWLDLFKSPENQKEEELKNLINWIK